MRRSLENPGTLSATIGRVYDSLASDLDWRDAMLHVGELLKGTLVSEHRFDHRERKGAAVILTPQRTDVGAAYNEWFGRVNPWMSAGARQVHGRSFLVGHQLLADAALLKTEFYADFLRPRDLFSSLGFVVQQHEQLTSTLTVMRPRRHGPYSLVEQRFVEHLVPHLRRATEWRAAQARDEAAHAATRDAFDRIDGAILTLTADATVRARNQAADELLESGRGASVVDGRLRLRDAGAQFRLRDWLSALARHPEPGATQSPVRARAVAAGSLEIQMHALRRAAAPAGREAPVALVVLHELDRSSPADPWRLREVYGLTRAEADVASELARGVDLREIAATLAITRNTVQTHLKKIFQKTGARRQAELVLLFARGRWLIRD